MSSRPSCRELLNPRACSSPSLLVAVAAVAGETGVRASLAPGLLEQDMTVAQWLSNGAADLYAATRSGGNSARIHCVT